VVPGPLSNYITTPIVGNWNVYTIPLSALCVGGGKVYKFAIQEESGGTSTWYSDNVGYTSALCASARAHPGRRHGAECRSRAASRA
jgi:hypothetical protein